MKITKQRLKEIIKEELSRVLKEDPERDAKKLYWAAAKKAGLSDHALSWSPEEVESLKSDFAELGMDYDRNGLEIDPGGDGRFPGVAFAIKGAWYSFVLDPDRGLMES